LLTRGSTLLDRGAIREIFAGAAPSDSEPSTGVTELDDGDRLAWRITRGNAEFSALLGSLRERADVEVDL